jgi:serine/threonine-protein kinase
MARLPADRFASVSEVAEMLLGTTRPAAVGLTSAREDPAPSSGLPERKDKAVAVLPFRNGGPIEDEYLADGLVDDLIDNLSMTPGLKVSSRGVVMAHKGGAQDPRELGRSLGVQVIVEGAIRRLGDHLRVSARVVSVADGFQLWSQRFDFPAGAFLQVSDAIVHAVAQALTVREKGPTRRGPLDSSAVDLYLRARHAYHRDGAARTEAIELFERALERSPDDAMILSGYAVALARRFADDSALDADNVRGKNAAERALAASPHLGEARVALASCMLSMGDPVGAAREAQRALSSSPGLADAHDLCGSLLMEAGALEEGVTRLRAALALEPGLEHASVTLAHALELLGQHEEVDAFFERALASSEVSFSCWMKRARIALWRRERERARGWLDALSADARAPRSVVLLLRVTAEGRLQGGMQELLDSAVVRLASTRRRAFFSEVRAEICAFCGDAPGLFKALDDADAAESFARASLERCPLFDPFRADPRYAPLHARFAARAAKVLEPLRASS